MNERIFDIARQSGATNEQGRRAETVFCFTKGELEGFTKRIVRECADICYNRDYTDGSVYGDAIHKHFGVQE